MNISDETIYNESKKKFTQAKQKNSYRKLEEPSKAKECTTKKKSTHRKATKKKKEITVE